MYPDNCIRMTLLSFLDQWFSAFSHLWTGENGKNILWSSKAEIKTIIYDKNIYSSL